MDATVLLRVEDAEGISYATGTVHSQSRERKSRDDLRSRFFASLPVKERLLPRTVLGNRHLARPAAS